MSTEVITKERPILFSGPMVRAILDGRKTVTRRLVKLPHSISPEHCSAEWELAKLPQYAKPGEFAFIDMCHPPESYPTFARCSYGQPGDRLWVRESLRGVTDTKFNDGELMPVCAYAADGSHIWSKTEGYREPWTWRRPTLPSIHMPRWACRIVLEITSVRVERLQEITEEDAIREGMYEFKLTTGSVFGFDPRGTPGPDLCDTAVGAFAALWKKINGAESWDANPWVWRVEFKRTQQERT